MGRLTKLAIEVFQNQSRLTPTRTLDGDTLTALQLACQAKTAAVAAPFSAPDASVAPPPPALVNPPPGVNAAPNPSGPPVPTGAPPAGGGDLAAEPVNKEFGPPDFPHDYRETNYEQDEMEGPRLQPMCLGIPEAPYSDALLRKLHKTVDVAEAVHVAADVFGEELVAYAGVGIEALGAVLGIIAGAIGPLIALGMGYSEGRAEEAKVEVRRGYIEGIVTGFGGEKWPLVKERLWTWSPVRNRADEDSGVVGQKAHNLGLAAGYLCGRDSAWNPHKHNFFWSSIRANLSAADRNFWHQDVQQYGRLPSSWPKDDWSYFYSVAGGIFSRLYLRDEN